MSRSPVLGVAVAAAAFFLTFALWLQRGWGGPSVVSAVGDIGSVLAGCFAVFCALATMRRSAGRRRRAWCMLAAAIGCWVLGDSVWALHSLVLRASPFPSPADIGYVLFYLCACAALLLLFSASGRLLIRVLFDGLMVAGSVFIIFWSAGLSEVFDSSDGRWFAFTMSVAYFMADLLLITVAALILLTAPTGQRAVLVTFTLGIGLLAVADGLFAVLDARGQYRSGGYVDMAWVAGLLLLGVAATVGARVDHHATDTALIPSRVAFWLPYVPVTGAVVVVVDSRGSAPLLLASLLVVFAVVGRQFVVADENSRLLASLSEQASRDSLTGLANREMFRDRLTRALTAPHRDRRGVALLSVDLDDFKSVNDSLGHIAGDALLIAVAERLRRCVPADQVVARLGGDEFAVLLIDSSESPHQIAHQVFSSFDNPFPVDGHHVLARASVGVTTTDGGESFEVDALLKQADMAMYSAKRNGGGVRHFAVEMQRVEHDSLWENRFIPRDGRTATLQFADQLRHALEHGELGVVYQPQFAVTTGDIIAVEALVRWHHPQRGMLRPDEFLPVVRHNDLMGALTDQVLQTAVRDSARWRTAGFDVPFAINLFPPSLGDPRLPEHLAEMLDGGGLRGDCLTVEITEDVLLAHEPAAQEVLYRLRNMGIRISIDDFGSGYAGLNYLRQLEVDEVKLDQNLITPMTTDPRAEAIVGAMIGLSHTLGLRCVAEGVQDSTTVHRLAQLHCDAMQGFYCGPPMSASHMQDTLSTHSASTARSAAAVADLRRPS